MPNATTVTDEDEVVIPALLRAARGSYAQAIRVRLAEAGFDDLPRHGGFVLGGMANFGGSAVDMIRGLGVSKQAARSGVQAIDAELAQMLTPAELAGLRSGLTALGRIKERLQEAT